MNKDICQEEYLLKFFKSFFAQRNNIGLMDSSLQKFQNLEVLNLSNNRISKVENLPPRLRELNLSNNFITELELLRHPLTSLIHIGLAYNKIENQNLVTIQRNFPNLFCLDLSFN